MTVKKIKFSQEVFNRICRRVATTDKNVKKICKANGISTYTFFNWLRGGTKSTKDIAEKLAQQYARAQEDRANLLFEQLLEIADDGTNDLMTITKGDVSYETENKEVTNRSRLRIDTRKWALSKLLPKKYGDKLDLDVKSNGKELRTWTLEVTPPRPDQENSN